MNTLRHLKKTVFCFFALVCLSAQATDFSYQKYDVYFGDVNSDGISDIYLDAKEHFVLLHGDVSVPILLPPTETDLVLMGYYISSLKQYLAPQVGTLTDAQLSTLTLASSSAAEYSDVTGDGILDLLITINDSTYTQVQLAGGAANVLPTLHAISNTPPPPPVGYFSQPGHDSEVGAIASQQQADLDGSANYTIPITALPGRAGMQPQLALSYNSNAGNGLVGVGWNLGGLSVIQRCATTLEQDGYIDSVDFDSNDKYCLDGQRLVLTSGSYGGNGAQYRTENESFSKIVSYGTAGSGPAYFKVWTRDGKISEYGVTANSRIEAQGKTDVLVWAINRTEDRYTNYMTYTYHEDNATGEYRIDRIDYTGNSNAGTSTYNAIQFNYQNRTDVETFYIEGSSVNQSKRLASVDVKSGTTTLKTLTLSYDASPSTGRSRLVQLEECTNQGKCLSPTDFNWSNTSTTLGAETSWATRAYATSASEQWRVDMNGDGILDVIYKRDGTREYRVLLNSESGFVGEQVWGTRAYASTATSQWLVDMNGDGLPDLVYQRDGVRNYHVLINNGASFGADTFWWSRAYARGDVSEQWFEDINGDGLTDYIYKRDGTTQNRALLNNGSSLQGEFLWGTRLYGRATAGTQWFADLNGDGLPDYIYQRDGSREYRALINNGVNANSEVVWGTRVYAADGASNQWLVDINADGITDYLYKRDGVRDYRVMIGDGTKFLADTLWGTRIYGTSGTTQWPVDVNGDGLTDIVYQRDGYKQYWAKLNDGGSFGSDYLLASRTYAASGDLQWPIDMTGDGQLDFVYKRDGVREYRILPDTNSDLTDQLASATNGLGVTTSFTYKPLTDSSVYTKGSGAIFPAIDLQYPQYVVSEMTTSNGIGGVFTTSYKYKGLRSHAKGLGSLGFSEMTTRNEDTGIETTTTFSQDYAARKHGAITQVKTTAANGTVLSDTHNTWNVITVTGTGIDRYRRQIASTEVTKRDLNNAFLHRETNDYTYDSYDNIKTISSKVYNVNNTLLRTKLTTNTYTNNTSSWLLGQMTKAVVDVTSLNRPTITRKSSWEYDATTGRKLAEKILEPVSETVLSRTDYENIDNFGNALKTKVSGPDFETRESTVIYDSSGRFVTSATNAIGHTASTTYYPDGHINAGLVDTVTDANGLVTKNEYDSFGRKVEVTAAYGTANPVSSHTSFQWCADMGSLCPMNAEYGITTSKDDGSAGRVYVDKLGREIKRSTRRLDGRFAHVGNKYNALGHNDRVCDPYYDGETEYFTDIVYDVLGRATQSTFADGRVDTVEYNGLTRISRMDITGANQKKTEIRDSLGNLIEVKDDQNNSVTYTYDSLGNMKTVTDPSSNVTTINYDALGRKTSMDDPDKGLWSYTYNGLGQLITQTDAKNQTSCSAYDKLGRMVKRIDNYQGAVATTLGQSANSTSQCAGDTSNVETATWVYDTASGSALGQLHKVLGKDNYQETYSYDSYSRNTQVQQASGGDTYVVNTAYDSLHRVEKTTYPGPSNRLEVKNIYNDAGFMVELRNAANNALYYMADEMDSRGNITIDAHGNDVITERLYDAASGQLEHINSYAPLDLLTNPTIQKLDFDFDRLDNLIGREDHLQGFDEDFTYDSLNRLTQNVADFGNADTRTTNVTYDALGNILTKTGVGTYSYGGTCNNQQAGPHAVTSITSPKSATYCYDANGNMISGDGRSITYTYFDKPNVITKGTSTTTIKYGPTRSRYQRIDQTSAGTTTYNYVGGIYEKVDLPNGDTEERHFVGGFAVVTHKNRTASSAGTEQTRYLHKDHLGSTTLITDEAGNIVEEFSFDPWGKRRAPSLADLEAELGNWNTLTYNQQANLTISASTLSSAITNKGFTGHEQLDEVGLIHMNGRVYDAEIGRFISADPFIQDRTNLQALNRYSYVLNNPLSYTDPSGFFLKKLFKKLAKAIKKTVMASFDFFVRKPLKALAKAIGKVEGLSTIISVVLNFIPGCQGWCSMVFNAAMSAANGGSLGDILTGAAVAFVASGIGDAIAGGIGNAVGAVTETAMKVVNAAGQMLSGGIASKAMGGKFIDGMKGAAIGMGLMAAADKLVGAMNSAGEGKAEAERGGDNTPDNGDEHDLEQLGTGSGRYSYEDSANQYGTPETIEAIDTLGEQWAKNNPDAPRIGIGDISVEGGGPMRGHASHQNGLDIDIRPMRNDGIEGRTTYQSSNYSSELTQRLVDTIRQNPNIRVILFNDPKIKGVVPWKGHDNHLHVSYKK